MNQTQKDLGLAQKLELIKQGKTPRHIGIIMDGNGRWAKERGMPRVFGHRAGVERLHKVVEATSLLGVQALSVYAFSTENWKRPADEVNALMSLVVEYLRREIDELKRKNVIMRFMGNTELPGEVLLAMANARKKTENNTGLTLNIALDYGSRAEVARAARQLAAQALEGKIRPQDIGEEAVLQGLDTCGLPELDMVIRTGGEKRLSNFMLLQGAYAELFFTDTYWPDFEDKVYFDLILEYQSRERRFGGLK